MNAAPGAERTPPPVCTDAAKPFDATPGPQQAIESHALLGPDKLLYIRHAGELYRLRLTRLGKLILTK